MNEFDLRHLDLLGYNDGDRVYLRTIAKTGQAAKLEATYPNLPALTTDRNIYVVVNGGGHRDADVTHCRAAFIEHDNLGKQVQRDLWQSLELPEPTFQIDTGGKSIHSYWVFDQPIAVEAWRSLQSDLLKFADADPTIKNPSRVMRLAGSLHQGTGQQATIITQSEQRYTYQELRAAIPEQAKAARKQRPQQSMTVGVMPLTVVLAPQNRTLIESGSAEGSRNASGAALVRDVIGCENWLRASGMQFDGSAEGLFQDYCDRCNPPLPDREQDTIWRSASCDSPTPTLSVEKILGCIQAWERRESRPQVAPQANELEGLTIPTKEGFEAYLEKLKRLNEIVDPIRKGYEVFAVSKADGYPLRQIEAALSHYRQRQGSKDKTVFELDEFLDLPFVANSWLIEGLVPCGETLILAGAPKEGKTLVAFDAAYCVATNRSKFLGIQPSKKGKVLLISSDESPRSTQARLKKRGFTAEDKGQLRIITRFNLQNLSELREQLVDFQPDLTIVDSLKSISQGSEVSENSAEFADSIYALKELFTQYDSAAILIHHTNKDRDAQGVAQVRGSTAIAGAVWGVCVLKTPRRRQGEEPPKDRWLEINPREGERRTLSIELEPSVNTWTVIGSTEQTSPDQATAKDRVVALLKGMNGKGLEFSEIRDLLPDIKRETLSTTLNRLVDSGIAGKRQSETNYKSWVYWMVSSVVSHGFMPVENMVSSSVSHPVSDPYETDHETERNDCQTTLSEVGFTNAPPRVVSHETMSVSPSVSHGFIVGSEEDDIDWEVTA